MTQDGTHEDHSHDSYRSASGETRATAPMDPFSLREVGIGAVLLVVGLAIVFGVPVLVG